MINLQSLASIYQQSVLCFNPEWFILKKESFGGMKCIESLPEKIHLLLYDTSSAVSGQWLKDLGNAFVAEIKLPEPCHKPEWLMSKVSTNYFTQRIWVIHVT